MKEESSKEQGRAEPTKRFWTRRKKRFFGVLLGLVVLCVGYYCYRDKPMKLVQTTDVERLADPKTGEVVDYHFAYDALQNDAIAPVEENGWRELLRTFGPLALGRDHLAEAVPWEEFPTNELSKGWFEGEWTTLCEKFKLDPRERPVALGRPSLGNYLAKFGLTGDEPEPDPESDVGVYKYWDDGAWRRAKIDYDEAIRNLCSKAWTAEEYPVPARWLEENADLFEAIAQAARAPHLECWRIVPKASEGGFDAAIISYLNGARAFACLTRVRACYRVGSGDISGAIDDLETAALFARALLSRKATSGFESSVGAGLLERALEVPLFGNADVQPTREESARIVDLWSSFYRDGQTARYLQLADKGNTLTFFYGFLLDFLERRRQGAPVWRVFDFECCPSFEIDNLPSGSFWDEVLGWLLFSAPPMNDAKTMRLFQQICKLAESMNRDEWYEYEGKMWNLSSCLRSSSEKRLALIYARITISSRYVLESSFSEVERRLKEAAIALALLAYRRDHGTFPPAFTVDENGKPLHSWRVLILPFLGAEAKALYDQIRLDEPWDSEYNGALCAQAPDVFRCSIVSESGEGETRYSVLLGDDGFFDESGVGKDPDEMAKLPGRDISRQFLLVERPDPICWTKPDSELKIADFMTDDESGREKIFPEDVDSLDRKLYVSRLDGAVRSFWSFSSQEEFESFLRGLPEPERKSYDSCSWGMSDLFLDEEDEEGAEDEGKFLDATELEATDSRR